MPIDNIADGGTERDGSKSSEYCKYCYGTMVNPNMTFEEMRSLVVTKMQKMNLSSDITPKSIRNLPDLKRRHNVQAMELL